MENPLSFIRPNDLGASLKALLKNQLRLCFGLSVFPFPKAYKSFVNVLNTHAFLYSTCKP